MHDIPRFIGDKNKIDRNTCAKVLCVGVYENVLKRIIKDEKTPTIEYGLMTDFFIPINTVLTPSLFKRVMLF